MKKKNVITVIVSKAIFDKAVKKMNRVDSSVAQDCLIAKAVAESFPRKHRHVSYDEVEISDHKTLRTFKLSKNAQRLIHRFDESYAEPESSQFKRLRASLPVFIKLHEVFEATSLDPEGAAA